MKAVTSRAFWQTFLTIGIFSGALAVFQTVVWIQQLGVSISWLKWSLLFIAYLLSILACAILWSGLQSGRAQKIFDGLEFGRLNSLGRWLLGLLAVLAFLAIPFIKLSLFSKSLPGILPLLWVFWWFSLLQAAGWKAWLRCSWAAAFVSALLFQGVAYQVYQILRIVSDNPFALGYSETSRFYYGSLWLSPILYGMRVPLSPWHATRYILLALPFLIHGLPLWAHRLWQALLWIALTGLSSWLLARRLKLGARGLALWVAAWSFIYLLQGPVYYYLQVCVILIVWGVELKHPWRSLLAVLLASFWAGMSGVNWYPVPAALAVSLYLLEQPVSEARSVGRYLVQPVIWGVLGVASALAGQAFYVLISGNQDLSVFHSSLDSALLWNRLLPSPAFPLGILPGSVLISLPLWLALGYALHGGLKRLHPIRLIGLGLALFVLFVGCLVVSIKIGGGADLHDMDAYVVLLQVVALYFFADRVRPESGSAPWNGMPWAVLVLAVLVPVIFPLDYIAPWSSYNHRQTQADLKALQAAIAPAAASGGQVLFISERQLIMFDYVQGVRLVPDDELVDLMEIAMSNNRPALASFYADLHRQRFALIISRKLNTGIKSDGAFSEENNAWSLDIAAPILCEYRPVLDLRSNNLQVYAPKPVAQTSACP